MFPIKQDKRAVYSYAALFHTTKCPRTEHRYIVHKKHFLNIFYFVSTIKIDCFPTGHTCPPSCNLERLRYNGKHSAKPFVRAAAEWAGAEHLPNPIKIGKRNRYESTHKSGQNAGCQVQLHQPDPAHCNRLVIGSVLALICPGAAWIEEFGNLFVGALKGVAPVLVFVIVASALAQGSSSWTAALVRWSGCTCSPPLWRLRSAL